MLMFAVEVGLRWDPHLLYYNASCIYNANDW
jgi:hypothetical protein